MGVAVVDGGRSTQLGGRPPAGVGGKDGNPWRTGWRSVFLLGATVVLVLLGLAFRQAAAVGKENPSLQASTPQVIGVFSTDPNATIRLTTEVYWHNVTESLRSPFATVFVSAIAPKPKNSSAILITSSLRPVIMVLGPHNQHQLWPDRNYKSAAFYSGLKPFQVLDPSEYVYELPLSSIERLPKVNQYGAEVGIFELPQITQASHGSFFVHLPGIGFGASGSFYPLPYFISESTTWSQPEKLIEGPQLKNFSNIPLPGYASSAPSEYLAPPGQHLEQVFWQPASLTTTEILKDVKSELENATVNSIVPSNGYLQGYDYVWQGAGFLEPTISITDLGAAASQSDWAFRSGIAFGVAAGTGIAFVQEENNPLLRLLGSALRSLWLRVRGRKRGPTPGRASRTGSPAASANGQDPDAGPSQSEIRAWAKAEGIEVNPRGSVSADVRARYLEAHKPKGKGRRRR